MSLTQEEVEAYESLKWELNLLQTNHTSMQYKLACTEEEAKQKYAYTAFKMQIVFEQGSASFPSLSHLKFCILEVIKNCWQERPWTRQSLHPLASPFLYKITYFTALPKGRMLCPVN